MWQDISTIKTRVRRYGGGEPLVVVHGWGGGGKKWETPARLLAKEGYEVFVPDLPGFGETAPPPAAWDLEDYAGFLAEFFRVFGLRRAVVVGHSFGGQLGVVFAKQNPHLARRLVLIAPPLFRKPTLKASLIRRLAKGLKAPLGGVLSREEFARWRRLAYRLSGGHDYLRARGVMKETLNRAVGRKAAAELSQLDLPILLLWGKKDACVSPREAVLASRLKPDLTLKILPQGGHDLPFAQAGWMVQEITKWLLTLSS
jgi:pimeloyl-ACP methyl ester carboxylesterase